MAEKEHILLVEDEENFGTVMKSYLELHGLEVDWAKDGNQGWNKVMQNDYDLCILDVMMPNKDGFTLASEIKEKKPDLPLIFLTAKSMKADQLKGYKLGAEDYLTKPFDSELLLYKIRVILKRYTREEKVDEYTLGNLHFNVHLRRLTCQDYETRLSPKENQLLAMLCEHLNRVTPREKALIEIWKNDDYFTKRSMDVYIAKLRKHIKCEPSLSIENIHGEGYRLVMNS